MYFYQKMIYYKLKKVISSKYNRKTEQRYQRAVVFVIENIATGTESFFQIDRIHKESASLRCQTRKCGHRHVIEPAYSLQWELSIDIKIVKIDRGLVNLSKLQSLKAIKGNR